MNNLSPRGSTRPKTRPQRGEAAGLKTPAASHRPLTTLGYVLWVMFKLFHYSLIIRSLFVLIRASCKRRHPKAALRYVGTLFRSLGSILRSLGATLGGSWAVLGRSWGDMQKSSKNRCHTHTHAHATHTARTRRAHAHTRTHTLTHMHMGRFGSLLGHFLSRLGVKNVEKTLCFPLFFEKSMFLKK